MVGFKRVCLCVVGFVLTGASALGAPPDPFGCQTGDAEALNQCRREALSELSNKGLATLSYKAARERMFQFVDAFRNSEGENVVQCVYTHQEFSVEGGGIPQNGVNTEHSWPQSYLKRYARFNESVADLHHLFPVEERENSRRGNFVFGECAGEPGEDELPGELCGQRYEVPEPHKGETARAMFYMAVTYDLPMDDDQEEVLREWNAEYPPTPAEIERDARVFRVQHNHNPFIAHPEWVNLISDY